MGSFRRLSRGSLQVPASYVSSLTHFARSLGAVITSQDPRNALATAVLEIEQNASEHGWDAPFRMFALVRTAEAVALDPGFLSHLLDPGRAASDPDHLTAIEQESLPPAEIEEILASITWPATVTGVAVVLERVIVAGADETVIGPAEALASPHREDVRIAAGVLRAGHSWCALRFRSHDAAAAVLSAPDMVPGLIAALRATLEPNA